MRAFGWIPLLWIAVAPGCFPPLRDGAPFDARNQHPAQLTAITPSPRSARLLETGRTSSRVTMDWTNIWILPGRGQDAIKLDGEILRTELDFTVGLPGPFDVQIELPFVHAGGGSLDSFIENWHDFWGLPNSDREHNPRGEFDMFALRRQPSGNLRAAYVMEPNGLHLGDLPIHLTFNPLGDGSEFPLQLALRGGIELPTGDEDDGYGNGGVDFSVGYLATWEGESWNAFTWGSRSWIEDADRAEDAGLSYPAVNRFGGGLEVALWRGLSALTQIEWEQSVLRRLDDSHADSDQVLIWFGGRARFTERFDVEFALAEDLKSRVSPDITFHVGFRFLW